MPTKRVARAPAPPVPIFKYKLSSGLFVLPQNAASVDWAVVNDTKAPQTFRVTVYKGGVGVAKIATAPGPLTETLAPGFVTHNANSVGPGQPFQMGFYYEVVVEANDRAVLPTVNVWQDHGGTAIAGTTIGPGDFVPIA
jgi:hypothetical protein